MKITYKLIISVVLICMSSTEIFAQAPGGVDSMAAGGQCLWMKANSATKLTLDASNTFVVDWEDENSTYSVSQTNVSKAPELISTFSAAHDFNFNPLIKFQNSATKVLKNASSSENFVGTSGTYFMICNAPTGTGSLFTYRGSNNIRLQAKPSWRLQNGVSGIGYVSDFGAPGIGPTGANFPVKSARVLSNVNVGVNTSVRLNSKPIVINLASSTYNPAVTAGLCIGANNTSEYSNDAIAELIIYPTTLSTIQVAKVESYLAMKYGVTLDSSVASNYLLSDASVIWTHANFPDFHHRITALVRDDSSALYQKQSKSVHKESMVGVYYGFNGGVFPDMNENNTSTILDKEFLIFGDNALDTNLTECFASGYMTRMPRTWMAKQSLNFNSGVTITIPNNAVGGNIKNLLVSQDPSFPVANTTVYSMTDNGSLLYAEALLGDSLFFTFASDSLTNTYVITPSYCIIPSGTATVSSTGGGGGYSYSWLTAPPQTGNFAQDLAAGIAVLEITHGNGCVVTENVAISAANYDLNVSDIIVDETCTNGNGTITLDANNSGTGPYTYSIDAGATTSNSNFFDNLSAGGYQIFVYDIYGCNNITYTANVNNIITPPLVTYDFTEPLCHGQSNASISLEATSPDPPYTYSIASLGLSNTTGDFIDLSAGTYVFTIVDAKNCNLDTAITITEPQELVLQKEVESSCWLYPTGRVTLGAYGGTSPYQYSYESEVYSDENLIDSISVGDHYFYVRDENGCVDSMLINVPQYPKFTMQYDITNVSCTAWNTGVISLEIVGSSSPYTYTWSDFPGEIIGHEKLDLYPGHYQIEVQDANMCTDTLNLEVKNLCCRPFVPTAFTPNGDGTNDYLIVKPSPDMDLISFEVFNRYGERVYKSLSQNPRWDGIYNGVPADVGTYIWKAEMICTDGREIATESFHLLR